MERYLKILQQYDKKVAEATRQFEKSVHTSERFRSRTRKTCIEKVALTLLKKSDKRIVSELSKRQLTPRNWWDNFSLHCYPDDICLEYLKCSRETYIYLITALTPDTKPKLGKALRKKFSVRDDLDTFESASVEKQIAVTLHTIGRSANNAQCASMFGTDSDVNRVFDKVITQINERLLRTSIKMPGREEAKTIARRFEDLSKIPHLIGALEATHIPIGNSGQTESTNSEDYPCYVVYAVVDDNYCFRDVSVTMFPRSADDQRDFEDFDIYKLPVHMPYRIAASHRYPLLPWLLTEFEPAESNAERTFNDHLRKVTYYSAEALTRLKARFAALSQQLRVCDTPASQIIKACCAIHNICENHNDPVPEKWIQESIKQSHKFPQPEIYGSSDVRTPNPVGIRLRDVAKEDLEKKLSKQKFRLANGAVADNDPTTSLTDD